MFEKIFWASLIIVAVVVMIWVTAKFKNARVYVFTIFIVLMIGSSCYSLIELTRYYSASGGIFGALIQGSTNDVNVNDKELKFDFKNISLTETGNENEYQATFVGETSLNLLDKDNFYCVYVNGLPCYETENGVDYVISDYKYNFYDDNQELILTDTLNFRFAIYNNSFRFVVTTQGGTNAVSAWNYFFNKQSFVVEVKEIELDNLVELDNIHRVDFVLKDEVISSKLVYDGNCVTDVSVESTDSYNFNYWTLDGKTKVDVNTNVINADTTYIAKVTNLYVVTLDGLKGSSTYKRYIVQEGQAFIFPTMETYVDEYRFDGFVSSAGQLHRPGQTVYVYSDETYNAVWTRMSLLNFYNGDKLLCSLRPGLYGRDVYFNDLTNIPVINDNSFIYWLDEDGNPLTEDDGFIQEAQIERIDAVFDEDIKAMNTWLLTTLYDWCSPIDDYIFYNNVTLDDFTIKNVTHYYREWAGDSCEVAESYVCFEIYCGDDFVVEQGIGRYGFEINCGYDLDVTNFIEYYNNVVNGKVDYSEEELSRLHNLLHDWDDEYMDVQSM